MGLAINLAGSIRPFPQVPLFGGWWVWLALGGCGLVVVATGWALRALLFFCRPYLFEARTENCVFAIKFGFRAK